MTFTARAKIAGVMGWPVAHSLSPQLHGYWLREHNIDGVYIPLPVPREGFSVALAGFQSAGFAGVNVTVPHKEAAFAIAHELDDAAAETGAVNQLVFLGDRFLGHNTDVRGLRMSLEERLGPDAVRESATVVLGGGGAARAAVLVCDRMGAASIRVVNRSESRAESLVWALRSHVRAELTAVAWADWTSAVEGISLLVNATSAGMKGTTTLALSLDAVPREAAVCDVVYNPIETKLLKAARARGHRVVDGLGMLMHQAVPAFEAFYGVTPLVTKALRAEMEKALQGVR